MQRRTFLATLLTVLGTASIASADIAPAPLPPLQVEGVRASVTDSGGPDHATFVLRNTSALPMEVFLDRVVLRDGSYNIPLAIDGARDEDGQDLGRRFTVPANATMRVEVRFGAADADARRWALTLRVMAAGRRVEGTARLSRAARDRR